ncbi:MAG: hypothetical protein MJ252_16545 [archaeon]|nr:hypothetical protein [archaeon]
MSDRQKNQSTLDTKLDCENEIGKISQFLNSYKNKFYTCDQLMFAKNITKMEASYILLSYVSKTPQLDNHVLIFEIEKEDQGKYSKGYLSSNYANFWNEINDPHIKSKMMYGICIKDEHFDASCLKELTPEKELIQVYDYEDEPIDPKPKKVKKKEDNSKMDIDTPQEEKRSSTNIFGNKGNATKKPTQKKTQTQSKINPFPEYFKGDSNMQIDKEEGEEHYYGGFNPKKAKKEIEEEEIPKPKKKVRQGSKSSKGSGSSVGNKRNVSRNNSKSSSSSHGSKLRSSSSESESDSSISDVPQPKMVRRVKKVKNTKTYTNDKGYMITVDENEEHEFWEEEKPKKEKKTRQDKDSVSGQGKKKKKESKTQGKLDFFFNKK